MGCFHVGSPRRRFGDFSALLDNSGLLRRFLNVKTLLTTFVLATAAAVAQQAAPEPTLKAGSAVSLEPVAAATWVQGEAPKSFEPGKVYMFECWATWCGPCIAAIPHVNELYKKYHAKGFNVFGMNVWEDGLDKVEKFVKAKGDGMSYPVAYTGKGSAFETTWLKAAGVRGIPHAFIVMDGKIVFTSHPSQITESIVEALLSGDEGAKKAADEINAAGAARQKMSAVMQAYRQAASKGDADAMAAQMAELEKLDPKNQQLASMNLDLLIAKKDWPAATKAIEEMPAGPARQMTISMTASRISSSADDAYPAEFVKVVCNAYGTMVGENKGPTSPISGPVLASLQWKSGDKDAAVTTAKAAAAQAAAATPQAGRPALPAGPFEEFAKSLEAGTLPTMREFSESLTKAMKAAAPKK
jgi:thiol-disulfide isomerase/thioredoxin